MRLTRRVAEALRPSESSVWARTLVPDTIAARMAPDPSAHTLTTADTDQFSGHAFVAVTEQGLAGGWCAPRAARASVWVVLDAREVWTWLACDTGDYAAKLADDLESIRRGA